MALIPEKVINFRVYGGVAINEQLGLVDVELPKIEFMTETISGPGISGEIESTVLGHTKSLTVKLKWRVATRDGITLSAQLQHALQLRASIQDQDTASGVLATHSIVIDVRGKAKSNGLGKFEVGKAMDAETEIEAEYLKITLAGEKLVEIDKMNFKHEVDGFDYLATVRADLGG